MYFTLMLQIMWSLALACVDIFSIRNKKDYHNPVNVPLIVLGDWVGHSFISFIIHAAMFELV